MAQLARVVDETARRLHLTVAEVVLTAQLGLFGSV
jgi:hypothetical protein